MSTQRIGQGIALLVSSIGASVICAIVSLGLLANAFTAALNKERAKRIEQRSIPMAHQATTPHTSLEDLFGPAKGSLILNINTASAKELESLPHIGSSRVEQIIAHRPYKSVDELSQVNGVTQRVMEQLRPFVKTDGATEKIKRSGERKVVSPRFCAFSKHS
jgi:DNA uptake protein ComE-like DNA-binding protein